jgi:hypothetical protein
VIPYALVAKEFGGDSAGEVFAPLLRSSSLFPTRHNTTRAAIPSQVPITYFNKRGKVAGRNLRSSAAGGGARQENDEKEQEKKQEDLMDVHRFDP